MKRTRKQACFPPAACEPELLNELRDYAQQKDMSVSAVMRQAVRIFLSANMPKSTVSVDNGISIPEEVAS
jgi:hypothetical protein